MGDDLNKLIQELDEVRRETFRYISTLSDEDLDLKNERGRSIRSWLQALADHDKEHIQHLIRARRAVGSRRGEINRLLSEVMASRGELMGLIAALPDEALDKEWQEGEWSIRNIIQHMGQTERTYIMDQVQKTAQNG